MGKKKHFDISKTSLYHNSFTHIIDNEIHIGIQAIKKILYKQNLIIKETNAELNNSIADDTYIQSLPVDQKQEYLIQFYRNEKMILNEISTHQLSSLCLLIYSFIEGRLKMICKCVEDKCDYKIKVEDFSSNDDLLKYWNYLTKVYEIKKDGVERFYTPIKQQKIVRNIIAHQDGSVKNDQLTKIVLVNGLKLADSGDNLQIQFVNLHYFEYLLDTTESFFTELIMAIDLRFKEINEVRT